MISPDKRTLALALVPLGIALNLSLGTFVHTLKLPVYVDAVGTIIVAILAGPAAGVVTGVGSFLIGGVLTNPVLPWFSGTQAAIALYVAFCAKRGWFRTIASRLAAGIGLGIVAGVVSAPIITWLFGGITGSGASVIVAFLVSSGRNLLEAVVMSGLAAEPLDKTLQCLLAVWLIRGMPRTVLKNFDTTVLRRNGLLQDIE